jgi:hypothetical protein
MASKGSQKQRAANAVNPFRLAELRSIVGPTMDNTSLSNLLKRADGVIEKAVNFYFDNDTNRALAQSATVPPDHALAQSTTVPDHRAVSAPKLQKLLKDQPQRTTQFPEIVETGKCEEFASGLASSRDVHRSRESKWPKFLGTTNVMAYTTVDLDLEKMPCNTQIFVCRRISAPCKKSSKGGMGSARRIEKKDYILRWKVGVDDSRECGRLPAEVSKPLAILLDAGWLEVDGCTLCAPDSSRKFANVLISLNIRMKCFTVPAVSNEADSALHAPHDAMIRLLEILKYVPRIPSELDIRSESAAELDFGITDESPKHGKDAGSARSIESKDDGTDVEGGELNKEHIDILFNEADQLNWKLPQEAQPVSMHTVLRDYQLQVLSDCSSFISVLALNVSFVAGTVVASSARNKTCQ